MVFQYFFSFATFRILVSNLLILWHLRTTASNFRNFTNFKMSGGLLYPKCATNE